MFKSLDISKTKNKKENKKSVIAFTCKCLVLSGEATHANGPDDLLRPLEFHECIFFIESITDKTLPNQTIKKNR